MGNGSTVRDSGRSDPQGAGVGNGTETADDGGASARNDGGGLLGWCRVAGRRVAIDAGEVFSHLWFGHKLLSLLYFVIMYTPVGMSLWWLHNDHVWLAAVCGAVVFWFTIRIAIALAVVQTITYYNNQQAAFHDQMQAHALAQMEVDGSKKN